MGDLVRFLLGLVEADQAALLAMEDHDRPERAVRLYLTLGVSPRRCSISWGDAKFSKIAVISDAGE